MSSYAENTQVSSERSRVEIERTLQRYGASAFAYGWENDSASIMFDMAGWRIRFTLSLPDRADPKFVLTPTGKERTPAAVEKGYEQAVRQRWRALALIVKAKLEAIKSGISTVETEFLANVVLASGSTVGEWVVPQLAVSYERNEMPALLPGGSQ